MPFSKPDPKEHEGGTGGSCDHTGVTDTAHHQSPNTMTLCIPIPHNHYEHSTSNLQSPSPSETVTLTPIKTIPIPQSTATTSGSGEKLMIKLPAKTGKENQNPGKMKFETVTHEEIDNKHTFCPDEYQQPIINMLEHHYCTYLLIPCYSHPTPAGIQEWEQMYNYCMEHDLQEVWAYLWENWYHSG